MSKLQDRFKARRQQLQSAEPKLSKIDRPDVPAKLAMEFGEWLKNDYKPGSTPPRERPVLQPNPEYGEKLAKLKDLYLQAKGEPESTPISNETSKTTRVSKRPPGPVSTGTPEQEAALVWWRESKRQNPQFLQQMLEVEKQLKTPAAAGDGFLPLLDKIKAQTDQKKAAKVSIPPRPDRPNLPHNPQYSEALQAAYQKAVEAGLIKPKQE